MTMTDLDLDYYNDDDIKDIDIDKTIDDIKGIDFANLVNTIRHAKKCQNLFYDMLSDVKNRYANLSDEKSSFLSELSRFIKTTSGKVEVKNVALEGDNCCRVVIDRNGISKIPYKHRRSSGLLIKDLIKLVSDDVFMSKVNIAFTNDQILKLRFECLLKVLVRLGEISDNLAVMQELKSDVKIPNGKFLWNEKPITGVRFEFSNNFFRGNRDVTLLLVLADSGNETGTHQISYSDFDDFIKILPLLPSILPKMIELRCQVKNMSEDFNKKLDSLKHELAPIYALEEI